MKTEIRGIRARQILDSRARPTVEAEVHLSGGALGRASVPSGASTGQYEAHELRDGEIKRYSGYGVLKAVANINNDICNTLCGRDASDQMSIDSALRELDGTAQLGRLGSNATLAVSLAVCRATAASHGQMLHERLMELAGISAPTMPVPMVNILSGGLHARGGMDIQDYLAIPVRAGSMDEAIHVASQVRSAACEVAERKGIPTLLADEGGLAPGFRTGQEALQMMVESIELAGYVPGKDVAIAIDVAANTLAGDSHQYRLVRAGVHYEPDELIHLYLQWTRDFPVLSIEDALRDDDWESWRSLTVKIGANVQLVGDDLFATNPARLQHGIQAGVANGILVKTNQNGTLSGAIEVISKAKAAGYATIVSARSGETEDSFIADLAVGTAAGQIKIGSLRTSNTMAKYNQLLRLAEVVRAPLTPFNRVMGRCR